MEELQLLQGVLERRTTIPILSNVLLTAEGDRLKIAATDLDVTVFARCAAQVRQEREGDHTGQGFLRPREVVADRHRRPHRQREPDRGAVGPVLVEARQPRPRGLPYAAANTRRSGFCRAVGAAAEDHRPYRLRRVERRGPFSVQRGTPGAVRYASRDGGDRRPPPRLRQGTAKRRRAAVRATVAAAQGIGSTAPSRGGNDDTVYLARGENHLAFRVGERMLLSRLLESRFPQYERVLVRDNPHKLRVQRQEFAASLRRVALLASERTHGVQLQFDTDTIGLSSVGFDIGSGEEKVECPVPRRGDEGVRERAVRARLPRRCRVRAVEMRLRDADGPIVLMPVDDERDDRREPLRDHADPALALGAALIWSFAAFATWHRSISTFRREWCSCSAPTERGRATSSKPWRSSATSSRSVGPACAWVQRGSEGFAYRRYGGAERRPVELRQEARVRRCLVEPCTAVRAASTPPSTSSCFQSRSFPATTASSSGGRRRSADVTSTASAFTSTPKRCSCCNGTGGRCGSETLCWSRAASDAQVGAFEHDLATLGARLIHLRVRGDSPARAALASELTELGWSLSRLNLRYHCARRRAGR